tara:strand:- start:242 stop:2044 length:1803 start_codon:yes stop_codon:yes gene_type:complete
MANKFVIEVRAKGFTNLEQQLQRADKATKGYVKSTDKLRGTTSGLRRHIGALRNNILLYTFAVGAAVKTVGTLVSASAKFEAVRTRLVGLTGSVDKANKAFDTFNQVAATTPFSLEDVVNAGAQLKAFGADAEALIKPITDLAAFMGTTATEAANSFGRAFAGGAGAADILRERGILNLIKTSQGLKDLSKTTLPEFRNALISSIQDPTLGIQGSTDRLSKTTTGAISNMGDAYTRLAAVIGDKLKPVTDATIQSLTKLAQSTREVIEGDTRTEAQKLTDEFEKLMEQYNNNVKASKNVGKEVSNVSDLFEITAAKTSALKGAYEDFSGASLELQAHIINENSSLVTQSNLLETNREKIVERTNAVMEQLAAVGGLGTVNEENIHTWEKLMASIQHTIGVEHLHLEKMEAIKELKPLDPITSAFKVLDSSQKTAIGLTRRLSDTFVQAGINGQNMGDAVKTALKSIAAEILSQAIVFGMLKTFFAPTTLGFGFGDFLAKSFGIGHTGGAVTKKGVQTFSNGGVVRGRDNVPILAQAGEFIIRRESAQSIGLDNLRQMNETGQPASVVVNIHGGVVQDDYVRNELIPALNTALTSGARINA